MRAPSARGPRRASQVEKRAVLRFPVYPQNSSSAPFPVRTTLIPSSLTARQSSCVWIKGKSMIGSPYVASILRNTASCRVGSK